MTQTISENFELAVPDGDDRERRVCGTCGFVDYRNPRIVAGSVVTSGDQILIHAAGGGVGLALVELATASGLEVIATDEASKRDAIMGAGARAFVDYRVDDLTAVVRDVTKGEGVALSINPVGGASLARDFELLAPFGEVILYGFLDGVPEATIAEALVPHFSESVALRVSDIYTLSREPRALPGDAGEGHRVRIERLDQTEDHALWRRRRGARSDANQGSRREADRG